MIKNVPFFSSLNQDEIQQVEKLIRIKQYAKDQIVLLEEETSSFMYIVYAGKVRVVKLNEDGREQILTLHKKGDFFGEMALLDGNTAPASVIADEEAVIGLLSRDDFDQHLMSHDEIRRKIITMLCERLRDSWSMIKILSFGNAEHRVMATLERMKEIYGVMDNRGVIIAVKLTHMQIANYASVSRETVTRVLNRFEKEQFIEILDNKCILLNNSFFSRLNKAA